MIIVDVQKLHPQAKIPARAHADDLGLDLSALEADLLLPGEVAQVRTGVTLHAPGCGFLLRERSGMARRGVSVLGGVIDPGYTGEVVVLLCNHGRETLRIAPGDRVAQAVPVLHARVSISEVRELPATERGAGGFGSTGR